MTRPGRILLFDIDGTLLLTQGAGLLAMNRAFRGFFGLDGAADPLDGVDFAGASDTWIVGQVAERHGLDFGPAVAAAFLDAYAAELSTALVETKGRLLPGIVALLDALQGESALLGLGTGNFRRTGMAKLDHFGIGHYFLDGGFGEDSALRPEILAAAVERLRPRASAGAEVVVIGDTVHDITAARAIGAKAVAVATGFSDRGDLEAAGPDALLPDCSDLDASLRAILS